MYVRPAGSERDHTVERYAIGASTHISVEARQVLERWTKTGEVLAPEVCARMEEEEQ